MSGEVVEREGGRWRASAPPCAFLAYLGLVQGVDQHVKFSVHVGLEFREVERLLGL